MWSSDSQWVIYTVTGDADQSLYRQRADGSSAAERLTTAPTGTSHSAESMSPDGTLLLFTESGNSSAELMLYSLTARSSTPVPGGKSAFKAGAAFSPDGKWIAYAIREEGTTTIIPFVQPYPFTGARYQLYNAREGGYSPAWSPDGRELFITPGPGQALNTVKVSTSPAFTFAPGETLPRPFLNLPPTLGRPFDVAAGPAGARLLSLTRPTAEAPGGREEVRVVFHWWEHVKGKVR